MGSINPKNKFAGVDAETRYLKQNILILEYFLTVPKTFLFFLKKNISITVGLLPS